MYSNGKVKKISGQIPQRISSGSWFLYNNKLCAFEARGGYTYLKISGESYQRVFVNRNIYKSPHIKQFSLKKNTYRLFKAPNLGSWKKRMIQHTVNHFSLMAFNTALNGNKSVEPQDMKCIF